MSQPSFRRSMGAFWLYTLLRFAIFAVLFVILWFVGVGGLLAALIALVLSVPLSYVLLSRPRAALTQVIEQRVQSHRVHTEEFNARLNGEDES